MGKFFVFLLLANLILKIILKLINIKIVLESGMERRIITIINLICVFAIICFQKDLFSLQLIKWNSYLDLFFIVFCHSFFILVCGLISVLIDKFKITKNQYETSILIADVFSFFFILMIFFTYQYDFIEYDLLVLLAAVLYGLINFYTDLLVYKKVSVYQLIFSGLVYFYSLFVFAATNNFLLTILFFCCLILPKYISYKKGVYTK